MSSPKYVLSGYHLAYRSFYGPEFRKESSFLDRVGLEKKVCDYVTGKLNEWERCGNFSLEEAQKFRFILYSFKTNESCAAAERLCQLWVQHLDKRVIKKREAMQPCHLLRLMDKEKGYLQSLTFHENPHIVHPDYEAVSCVDGEIQLFRPCMLAFHIDPSCFSEFSVSAARPVAAYLNGSASQVLIPQALLKEAKRIAELCHCLDLASQIEEVYQAVTGWEDAPRENGNLPPWALKKLQAEFASLPDHPEKLKMISCWDMEFLLRQDYELTEFEIVKILCHWLSQYQYKLVPDLFEAIRWANLSDSERLCLMEGESLVQFAPYQRLVAEKIEDALKKNPSQPVAVKRVKLPPAPLEKERLSREFQEMIQSDRYEMKPLLDILSKLASDVAKCSLLAPKDIDSLRQRTWDAVWNREIFEIEYKLLSETMTKLESAWALHQAKEKNQQHHFQKVAEVRSLKTRWKAVLRKAYGHLVVTIPDRRSALYEMREHADATLGRAKEPIHSFLLPKELVNGGQAMKSSAAIGLVRYLYGLKEVSSACFLKALFDHQLLEKETPRLLGTFSVMTKTGAILRCRLTPPEVGQDHLLSPYKDLTADELSLIPEKWYLAWARLFHKSYPNSYGGATVWKGAMDFARANGYTEVDNISLMQKIYDLITWNQLTFTQVFQHNPENRAMIPEQTYIAKRLEWIGKPKESNFVLNDGTCIIGRRISYIRYEEVVDLNFAMYREDQHTVRINDRPVIKISTTRDSYQGGRVDVWVSQKLPCDVLVGVSEGSFEHFIKRRDSSFRLADKAPKKLSIKVRIYQLEGNQDDPD